MIQPPRLPVLMLRAVAPRPFAQCLEGDLEEEFHSIQIAERGDAGARLWYWRQVLRSARPLIASALGSSDWQTTALLLLAATAGQIVAIDAWWSFILSHVPLKDDVARGMGYLGASLAITLLASAAAGARCPWRGLVIALPFAALTGWLGVGAMRGVSPGWFSAVTGAAAAAGVMAGSAVRQFWNKGTGR